MKSLAEKILSLSYKILKNYNSRVELINELNTFGLSRHELMVLELILLGKQEDSIAKILLFRSEQYDDISKKLYKSLKEFKSKNSVFRKIIK